MEAAVDNPCLVGKHSNVVIVVGDRQNLLPIHPLGDLGPQEERNVTGVVRERDLCRRIAVGHCEIAAGVELDRGHAIQRRHRSEN